MPSHALAPRSVVLSWTVALTLWPIAWVLPLCAQGLATAAVGGEWIGLALPWGGAPWALVNEPTIAFASSRAALWAYWLPPLLLPLVLAFAVPALAPSSGRWVGELVVFHLGIASATLGLAWAPRFALADGWLAGLAHFGGVRPEPILVASMLAGCAAAPLAFRRLGGRLWPARGGATPWRRVALVLLHGLVPGGAWAVATHFLGWPLTLSPLIGLGAVFAVAMLAAVTVTPRTAVRPDLAIGGRTLLACGLLGLLVLLPAAWAGAARSGRAVAVLWGQPSQSNNVRPAMLRFPLTPPPVATAPPGS